MPILVTRFHLLLLWVTIAITAVAFLRIPASFHFPAHWSPGGADWLWPRDVAIAAAPFVQALLLAIFFALGRLLSRDRLLQSQHVLDPFLTLVMTTVAANHLGLLLIGFGSDIDFVRLTAAALGLTLVLLGIVLFGAQRHTYAGLRLPWPLRGERAWQWSHRTIGLSFGAAGILLGVLSWNDPGIGILFLAQTLALLVPVVVAAAVSAALVRFDT